MKFERLLGNVWAESRHTANILANWGAAADRERNIQNQTAEEIGGTLIGTFTYDFKNGTEKFVRADEKSEIKK